MPDSHCGGDGKAAAIIDIAPIAAPSNAGKDLESVYGYFTDYQTRMVKELSVRPSGSLPMVAFGAPVRSWIKQQYGQTVGVLGLAQISPEAGKTVSVLGSNHPSYIWYAASPDTYDGDEQKADEDRFAAGRDSAGALQLAIHAHAFPAGVGGGRESSSHSIG